MRKQSADLGKGSKSLRRERRMITITYKVYSYEWIAAVFLNPGERFSFDAHGGKVFEVMGIENDPSALGSRRIRYFELDSPELGTGVLWATNIVRPIKTMVKRT